MDIDLLFLSRDLSPPRQDVWRGIEMQHRVRLLIHRVIGTPRADDPNRWETICRARNQGKQLGSAPWVMCLDDDVILGAGCVARLLEGLQERPGFAALAADSAGEMTGGWENWDYPTHVGMAAVLFRRERLAKLTFRWEPRKCECRCCCDDLRRAGFGIGYLPRADAWHNPLRPSLEEERPVSQIGAGKAHPDGAQRRAGRVLAAFNRRDFPRFCRQFLPTLRAAGNQETVTAVAYGLYPSEQAALRAKPGVEVVTMPDDGVSPSLRRLRDFQSVLVWWPEEAPVAYWDAGDIFFQSGLEPLWDLVRADPDVLLVGREPLSHPENPVIRLWTDFIRDPAARRRAFALLSTHPFLNGGFAAGTVRALLRYLREGERLLNSADLDGVGAWGDQAALNLFCYNNPDAFQEISAGWNFTLAGRDPREYRIGPDGRFTAIGGPPIHVVHGNGGSLGWRELAVLA